MDVPETLHDLEVIPGTTMGIVLQLTTTGLQFQKTASVFSGRKFGTLNNLALLTVSFRFKQWI